VLWSLLPILFFVVLIQFFLVPVPLQDLLRFLVASIFVYLGLSLFLLGIKKSLLEFGEAIGKTLTLRGKLWIVLVFGFIVGFVVTVAEPDVQVLTMQIDKVSAGAISKEILILFVALGVGIFVALAMVRIIFNLSLRFLLGLSYAIVLLLVVFSPQSYIPVAFDAGGVTTGPMTVPLILSLGMGVSSLTRNRKDSQDSFGLIALASIGPIMAVLILGMIYR
jgi:hypothetical protein